MTPARVECRVCGEGAGSCGQTKTAGTRKSPAEVLKNCVGFVLGLANARPDLATLAAQTDLTAFEKIGDRRDGFAVVLAVAAHGQNEIAEAIIVCGFFKWLFHGAVEVNGGRMQQMECHRAEGC
jgi:hypothetical protein